MKKTTRYAVEWKQPNSFKYWKRFWTMHEKLTDAESFAKEQRDDNTRVRIIRIVTIETIIKPRRGKK